MTSTRKDRGRVVTHSPTEVAGIRAASRVTALVLNELRQMIRPGMTTLTVDQLAGDLIRQQGGESAFYLYRGFPGQICISLNDEVVHGIGSAQRIIRPGDLVSLDIGVRWHGFIGDSATSFWVGDAPPPEIAKLLEVTETGLYLGIDVARAGNDVSEIGRVIERHVKGAGFSVVRDFVGHGCGCQLHEPPEIPNFAQPAHGPVLRSGMTLAIEPMVNIGGFRVSIDADGWTVRTIDRSLSAHFEHMVLVTDGDAEILTCPKSPLE